MTRDLHARCRRILAVSICPWMRALLLVACAALTAVWWRVADRDPAPTGIVIITLDTIRVDRLSAYGFMNGSQPHLDRLARDGVIFDQAIVGRALDAAGAQQPVHGTLPAGTWRPRQCRSASARSQRDARGAVARPGLPNRSIHRFDRARRGSRAGPGIRALQRPRRSRRRRRNATGVPASCRRRCDRRYRLARRRRRVALLSLGASLRSAPALRSARALPVALLRSVPRRDCVRRRANWQVARRAPAAATAAADARRCRG